MVQIELMLDAAALVSCDWLELIKSPPPWKLVEMVDAMSVLVHNFKIMTLRSLGLDYLGV